MIHNSSEYKLYTNFFHKKNQLGYLCKASCVSFMTLIASSAVGHDVNPSSTKKIISHKICYVLAVLRPCSLCCFTEPQCCNSRGWTVTENMNSHSVFY